VVAAAALKRVLWAGGAVGAVAAIIVLASYGQRPDPGLVRFHAAGVMVNVPPERVGEVVVARGDHRWRFVRAQGGWIAAPGTQPLSEDGAGRIERGLRFLHASAPERVMRAEELAGTPLREFGLDPPRYSVSARAGGEEVLRLEFGALNPYGLAQYARVEGHPEVLLLPSFVGDPWKAIIGDPP
jgi:Domain of unknown function (DUF4340)